MATKRGQAMMELAVGVFALALVVSALCGFAVYIARSLRVENTARSSHPLGHASVDVRDIAGDIGAKYVFGSETLTKRNARVEMPLTHIAK